MAYEVESRAVKAIHGQATKCLPDSVKFSWDFESIYVIGLRQLQLNVRPWQHMDELLTAIKVEEG